MKVLNFSGSMIDRKWAVKMRYRPSTVTLYNKSSVLQLSGIICEKSVRIQLWSNSVWARTTKRGVSLPVSGQRLTVFFGKLIMSRTQNDVITVWIL